MNHIMYKLATESDAKLLAEYRLRFAQELLGVQPPEKTAVLLNQLTNYFAKPFSESGCISFIASVGNEVAGIGTVHIRELPGNYKILSGKWGYIMNMYTVPAFRRKGICKGILQCLTDEASKYGVEAFELHATEEGEFVYKLSGFKLHQEPTYRKFIQSQ